MTYNKEKIFAGIGPDIKICLILVIATLAVYGQVINYDFISFDDIGYIVENPHVRTGLTPKNILWAFTSVHAGNWHPLTWLSHQTDVSMYGMNPGLHHLSNVIFHIANTLLLFFVFRQMTGSISQSGFAAALFALHPLHVESVAWVSERKDVLSTLFWLLTMKSYFRYIRYPGIPDYLTMLLCFMLCLMSKPMVITLPFVLLLMDYWPLRRVGTKPSKSLLWEKIPLVMLAAASVMITFFAQKEGGAVASWETYSFGTRAANALISYFSYIEKMFLPFSLAIYYPYPPFIPWWKTAGAGVLLISVSLITILNARQRPYLTVGWLWYLGTLLPVIGLVQVGSQAMADRYFYIPSIGLFIMMVWGVPELFRVSILRRKILSVTAAACLFILMTITAIQVRYWTDSLTLFSHTIDVTENNAMAFMNMGVALNRHGKKAEAVKYYTEALRLAPGQVETLNKLGLVLKDLGKTDEAIQRLSEALSLKPDDIETLNNLGAVLKDSGRSDEAIRYFSEALQLKPGDVGTLNNIGLALADLGETNEAIRKLSEALQSDPEDARTHNNMGIILAKQGKTDAAIRCFFEAQKFRPDYADAYYNMGNVFLNQGKADEAIRYYSQALELSPRDAVIYNNMGIALLRNGKIAEAMAHFQKALEIKPDYADADYNLREIKKAVGKARHD